MQQHFLLWFTLNNVHGICINSCRLYCKELQCPRISRDCERHASLNIPACRLQITSIWVSTNSIVLPGTLQKGRSETGNATDPSKPSNFKMHWPCSTCTNARCKTCSSDCIAVVLHRSLSYSYLPLAETFPLCFDGGEGKHKRLCLLSHSLPPSPSHWSFSGLLCNKDAKYKPRSSCTWSLFASEPCVSVQRAILQLHTLQKRQERDNFAIALQRILRSTYMMGQGWQLKPPNLDQCEPLRENVLPAWSAGGNGNCSPGSTAAIRVDSTSASVFTHTRKVLHTLLHY